MSHNKKLTAIFNLYADQQKIAKVLAQLGHDQRQQTAEHIKELVVYSLLLKISSLLDPQSLDQFHQFFTKHNQNEKTITEWLDKHIPNCTLTLKETADYTLLALE